MKFKLYESVLTEEDIYDNIDDIENIEDFEDEEMFDDIDAIHNQFSDEETMDEETMDEEIEGDETSSDPDWFKDFTQDLPDEGIYQLDLEV